jgi:hypothetical protein
MNNCLPCRLGPQAFNYTTDTDQLCKLQWMPRPGDGPEGWQFVSADSRHAEVRTDWAGGRRSSNIFYSRKEGQ